MAGQSISAISIPARGWTFSSGVRAQLWERFRSTIKKKWSAYVRDSTPVSRRVRTREEECLLDRLLVRPRLDPTPASRKFPPRGECPPAKSAAASTFGQKTVFIGP